MEQLIKNISVKRTKRDQKRLLFGNKRYWFHIIFWLCSIGIYILTQTVSVSLQKSQLREEYSDFNKVYYNPYMVFISILIAVALNYLFLLQIVPYSKAKLNKLYTKTFIYSEIILYLLLSTFLGLIGIVFHGEEIIMSINTMLLLIFGFQITFFSFFYFLDIYNKQHILTNYKIVLEQRMEAESKFLSTQVNPHFLFNTLNNIYSLSFHDRKKAKESIERMLSLISYIHNESDSNLIELQTEIDFLKSYLELELLRSRKNNVHLIFEVDGDISNKKIAPLLLINFVENAFKHGTKSPEEKSFIVIRIDAYEQNTVFIIRNKKSKGKKTVLQQSIGGIGLRNVKSRLNLIYPKRHRLKIRNKKAYYEVKLNLDDIV